MALKYDALFDKIADLSDKNADKSFSRIEEILESKGTVFFGTGIIVIIA
jgi:hypothetical protein